MKRTIEEVLDEMVGANYMITAAQICEIAEIHSAEIASVNDRIREAYFAGRKHDRPKLEALLLKNSIPQGIKDEKTT